MSNTGDLFDNPMVENAKKMLSPEQIEEYKKIGEYMYSNEALKQIENKSLDKVNNDEYILRYASEALNSGLSPLDLSQTELDVLKKIYGDTWYEKFGLTIQDIKKDIEVKVSRQYRRKLERQMKKKKY
jgi:hypothetical protein